MCVCLGGGGGEGGGGVAGDGVSRHIDLSETTSNTCSSPTFCSICCSARTTLLPFYVCC